MATKNQHEDGCLKLDVFKQINESLGAIFKKLDEKYMTKEEFDTQKKLWEAERALQDEKVQRQIDEVKNSLAIAVLEREKDMAELKADIVERCNNNKRNIDVLLWTGALIATCVIGWLITKILGVV